MTELILKKNYDNKYDLDELQSHFMKGGVINHDNLKTLIQEAKDILKEEPNLVEIESNCLIFGDFHGQYFDFLNELSDSEWTLCEHKKVFLGDYVDRGDFSCEILITLLCMKVNEPNDVILLRGNHESRAMTTRFGFKTEAMWKYSTEMYYLFCDLFDCIPLGVILNCDLGKFFLCHGGISPKISDLDDIMNIDRFRDPPHSGLFCDMLWSDPVSDDFFYENPSVYQKWEQINYLPNGPRNCSYFYGYRAICKFMENTDVRAIIRGHQCVSNGIEMHTFGDDEAESPYAFTIFSAPDYSGGNKGAAMMISDTGINVRTYNEAELKNQYEISLVNGITFGMFNFMMAFDSIVDRFIDAAFNSYDPEDDFEDDEKIDYTALIKAVNEYENKETKKEEIKIEKIEDKKEETKIEEKKEETKIEEKKEEIKVEEIKVEEKKEEKPKPKRRMVKKGKVSKTGRKPNSLSMSFTSKPTEEKPKKISILTQSIVTSQPSRYEKKKVVRAESAPVTIEELRNNWLTSKKNYALKSTETRKVVSQDI